MERPGAERPRHGAKLLVEVTPKTVSTRLVGRLGCGISLLPYSAGSPAVGRGGLLHTLTGIFAAIPGGGLWAVGVTAPVKGGGHYSTLIEYHP